MKKIKLYAAVCAVFAMMAFVMTSCNEGSSYRSLTKEEIKTAYYTVRGNHYGKMVYSKKTDKYVAELDTIDINWTIDTDSTMYIGDFPTYPFAEWITNAELKEELLKQPNISVKCKIAFFDIAPIWYYIGVEAPTYNLTYGGKEHKIQLAFYSSGNSVGVYDVASKYMEMQIIGGGVYEDGVLKEEYLNTTNIPFLFFKKG